jgi:hypothetical protein
VKRAWEFLGAWWFQLAADAECPDPGSGGGEIPTRQTDNTVKWVSVSGLASDIIEVGDVLYEDGNPLYEGAA